MEKPKYTQNISIKHIKDFLESQFIEEVIELQPITSNRREMVFTGKVKINKVSMMFFQDDENSEKDILVFLSNLRCQVYFVGEKIKFCLTKPYVDFLANTLSPKEREKLLSAHDRAEEQRKGNVELTTL